MECFLPNGEGNRPLVLLVSSRCHFSLPALLLQNVKSANVFSGGRGEAVMNMTPLLATAW